MAPRTFVEEQRLERARHLLELTSLPVHMAAAQLGLSDSVPLRDALSPTVRHDPERPSGGCPGGQVMEYVAGATGSADHLPRRSPMATKLWHVPVRLATGAIILDQGLQKLGADEDTARWLDGQAAQAFPRFADMDPRDFVQLLSAGEIALGTALLGIGLKRKKKTS
jgi:hypothetical protein